MQSRRIPLTQLIVLMATIGPAFAGPDEAGKRSRAYEVQTDTGQEVMIQRRSDGSFDLDFGPEDRRPSGPSGKPDEELLVSLPAPVLAQLLERWQPEVPVAKTMNGWWVLRFDGADGPQERAMVLEDIASRMGWPWLAHKAVGTLYLRPDVIAR